MVYKYDFVASKVMDTVIADTYMVTLAAYRDFLVKENDKWVIRPDSDVSLCTIDIEKDLSEINGDDNPTLESVAMRVALRNAYTVLHDRLVYRNIMILLG